MTERAVVLIGPMGAGKTSVGKRLAKELGLSFYDSDAAVVREHGPIDQLFAEHGEAHFRALERDAVRAGLARGGVVSLGGGAVLDPETQRDLSAHRVVLLTVRPETVPSRIRRSRRPLLQDEDPLARWNALYEQRRDTYERLANATFDTSVGPLQDVVTAVASWVRGEIA
jgi:shikimate kinase